MPSDSIRCRLSLSTSTILLLLDSLSPMSTFLPGWKEKDSEENF